MVAAASSAKKAAAVGGLLAGVLVLAAPATAEAPPRTCGTPTIEWLATAPAGGSVPIDAAGPGGPLHSHPTVDMDGDGNPDAVTGPDQDGNVTVTRADGVLEVHGVQTLSPGPFGGEISVIGDDLDGDGRDELIVSSSRVTSYRYPTDRMTAIVRGTTPVGTVEADDVALTTRTMLTGDVDGDGLDDLVAETTDLPLGLALIPPHLLSAKAALGGPDPTVVPQDVEQVGGFWDLDLDGLPDRVGYGSNDWTTPGRIDLSSGASAEVPPESPDAAPRWTVATRSDVQTLVAFRALYVEDGSPGTGIARIHATCAQPWMSDATALVMGRAPIAADYPTFGPGDEPDAAARLARAKDLVRSQTGRGHLVDDSFAWFLDRPADPAGRDFWIRQLRSGRRTAEHLMVELMGSGERYRTSGSDPQTWISDAYHLLYGRDADPGGRAYWTRQLAAHGPGRTAARMFGEAEAHRFLVHRYATDPDAYGESLPEGIEPELVGAEAAGHFDGFLAELVARPDHYLLANQRHLLAGS